MCFNKKMLCGKLFGVRNCMFVYTHKGHG